MVASSKMVALLCWAKCEGFGLIDESKLHKKIYKAQDYIFAKLRKIINCLIILTKVCYCFTRNATA